ncbi:MAG TPA: hypothetical protein VH679_15710, partial [Vicinamibacterales bacterium]
FAGPQLFVIDDDDDDAPGGDGVVAGERQRQRCDGRRRFDARPRDLHELERTDVAIASVDLQRHLARLQVGDRAALFVDDLEIDGDQIGACPELRGGLLGRKNREKGKRQKAEKRFSTGEPVSAFCLRPFEFRHWR